MAKVFVSYSRKDITFAKRLTGELQVSDLDFWIDWEGIPPTVDWWREIEKGIEEADIFLFLISPDSVKSRVCGQEIDTAVRNGKRIIPIVVRDSSWDETPPQLRHLNYIFLRESDDFDAAVKKLITAIQTDYEWAATQRRLQVKALDWERNGKESGFLLRGADLLDAESDLAANTSKDPHPTDLQREYVFESRKATDRQRRTTTSIAIGGTGVLAVLTVVAIVMAVRATQQAKIALARQLISQAQFLNNENNSNQMIASLLSVQSMKLFPNADASTFLINHNYAAQPIAQMKSGTVSLLRFSPDGRYVASVSCWSEEKCVRIWESTTGKEVFHLPNRRVSNVVFSQDGERLLVSNCDQEEEGACLKGSIRVYETDSGLEIDNIAIDKSDVVIFSPDRRYIIWYSCGTMVSFCSPDQISILDLSTRIETAHPLQESGEPMTVAAMSPDGKYFVSFDAAVREVGKAKEVFSVYDDVLSHSSAAFSQDGNYLALVGGGFHIWDIVNKQEIVNTGFNDFLSVDASPSAYFSPDGKHVVVAGTGVSTRIWNISGDEIARLTHPSNLISFSPDSRYFVSGNQGNVAIVRETATGLEVARMTHDGLISAVTFSPDGQYVASEGGGMIRIWKVATGMIRRDLGGHGYFSSNHESIFAVHCEQPNTDGSCNQYLGHVWDIASSKEGIRFPLDGEVQALSADGNYVQLTTCEKRNPEGLCVRSHMIIRETLTGDEVLSKSFDFDITHSNFTFSPTGKFFIGKTSDNVAYVWETATGKELRHITLAGRDHSIDSLVLSPDDHYLLSAGEGSATLWDIKTGKEITSWFHDSSQGNAVFSPNSEYVVTMESETAQVWEVATEREVLSFPYLQYPIAFSPNSQYLASVSSDNTLHVWKTRDGKETVQKSFLSNPSSLPYLKFTPDNRYLVYTDQPTSTIYVWDFAEGREVKSLSHDGPVTTISFNSDGKSLVSTSGDVGGSEIHLWDMTTGREVARMNRKINVGVYLVHFIMDGKYVISLDTTGTIRLWPWQPEDVIRNACAFLPRNLTRAEWDQYIGDARPYEAVCPNLPTDDDLTSMPTP